MDAQPTGPGETALRRGPVTRRASSVSPRDWVALPERFLQSRSWAWRLTLAFLAALPCLLYWRAVGGDWWRSGNDMAYILDAARPATTQDVLGWVTGPWIAEELFRYFRP